jgi:hypothetical protein
MQITFDPEDPRDTARMFNTLRLLGAIDAAVTVTVGDDPTLSAKEALAIQREMRGVPAPLPRPHSPQFPRKRAAVQNTSTLEDLDLDDLDI